MAAKRAISKDAPESIAKKPKKGSAKPVKEAKEAKDALSAENPDELEGEAPGSGEGKEKKAEAKEDPKKNDKKKVDEIDMSVEAPNIRIMDEPDGPPDAQWLEVEFTFAPDLPGTAPAKKIKTDLISSYAKDSRKVLGKADKQVKENSGDAWNVAVYSEYLSDSVCARAIYSVTEALTTAKGAQTPKYGIVESPWRGFAIAEVGSSPPDFARPSLRPRSDLFFPFIKTNHITLMRFRIDPDDENTNQLPSLWLYNSLPKYYDEEDLSAMVERASLFLGANSYLTWPNSMNVDGYGDNGMLFFRHYHQKVAQQAGNWACGVHTICNAWTLALGLAPDPNFKTVGKPWQKMAIRLINAAILTGIPLQFIYQFLVGSGFAHVLPTSPDPDSLAYNSIPFPDDDALNQYVGDAIQERDQEFADHLDLQAERTLAKSIQDDMSKIIIHLLDRTHVKISGPGATGPLPQYDAAVVGFHRRYIANPESFPRLEGRMTWRSRLIEVKRILARENFVSTIDDEAGSCNVENIFQEWAQYEEEEYRIETGQGESESEEESESDEKGDENNGGDEDDDDENAEDELTSAEKSKLKDKKAVSEGTPVK